jgi:TPR repeat protein
MVESLSKVILSDSEAALEAQALLGDPDAQFQLGVKYFNGIGTAQDFAAAAQWFAMAAAQGHADALLNLGLQFMDGHGVEHDLSKAKDLFLDAVAKGQPLAAHNLGYLAETAGHFSEAVQWYEKAVELGHVPSLSNVAYAYSNGRGVFQDVRKAFALYEKAVEHDQGIAAANLGTAYLYGHKVDTDHALGYRYLHKAAELDYQQSYYHLAIACDNGWGTGQDPTSAQTWMTLAVLSGDPQAQKDIRTRPDRVSPEMTEVLSRACSGVVEAISEVGVRLHEGRGIQRDEIAAKAWIKQAALRGDPWAQTSYALVLRSTKTRENEIEAHRWLAKAAEQGDGRAIFNKGLNQITGVGTPIDVDAGANNILTASLWGVPDARNAFEMLIPSLSEEKRKQVEAAVNWPSINIILGLALPKLTDAAFDEMRADLAPRLDAIISMWALTEATSFSGMISEAHRRGKVGIGPSIIKGETFPSIYVSMEDLRTADGHPVYWRPGDDEIEGLSLFIKAGLAASWCRHFYLMV